MAANRATLRDRACGAMLGLVAADREWHPRPGPPGYPAALALVAENAVLYGITRGECRGIAGDWDSYAWMAFRRFQAAQTGTALPEEECGVSWVAKEAALRGAVSEEPETREAVAELAAGRERASNASERPESLPQVVPVGIAAFALGWDRQEAGRQGAQLAALTRPSAASRVAAAYLAEVAACLAAGESAEEVRPRASGAGEQNAARRLRRYLARGVRIPSRNGAPETAAFAVRTLREEAADWRDAMRLARRWQPNPCVAALLVGMLEGLRRGAGFVAGGMDESDPVARIACVSGTDLAEGWRVCRACGDGGRTPEERRWIERYVRANGPRAGEET